MLRAEVVPTRPTVVHRPVQHLRDRIEQATQFGVGLGMETFGADRNGDGPQQVVQDIALGALMGAESFLLGGGEHIATAAATVANLGARVLPLRSAARWTRQLVEPLRRRGSDERARTFAGVRTAVPSYTDRAVMAALDLISVNDLADRLDVNRIIERVDVNRVIERVDVNHIVERVDVEHLLERVDIGQIMDRLDLNELMRRIDLDALVERTDLGAVIARSSGGIASGTVDLVRRQGVGLDEFVGRWAARVRPHQKADGPLGPPLLVSTGDRGAENGESKP